MVPLRVAHLVVGWAAFAVFLGSGFYLRGHMVAMVMEDPDARFAVRANHIYILMGGLLNLALAAVPVASAGVWGHVGRFGRVLVIVAPAVLFAAFVVEGPHPSPYLLQRPLTVGGVFALTIGVLCAVGFVRPGASGVMAIPSRS